MKDEVARSAVAIGDDDRMRALLEETCRLTGMGFAAVAYVSEERWIACQIDDRINFGLQPGDELEVRKTICDEIRDRGQAVLIDDVHNNPDWWNHPEPVLYGFRSYVSLPIFIDGQFFGTLCAIDPEPRSTALTEIRERLEALADQAMRIIAERLALKPGLPLTGANLTTPG